MNNNFVVCINICLLLIDWQINKDCIPSVLHMTAPKVIDQPDLEIHK